MYNDFPFPHISRVVDLPPEWAKEAFDAVACDGAGDGGGRAWRLVVPSGRLDLERDGVLSPPGHEGYWPYRRAVGRLWPPGTWRGLLVELELLPWSKARTALGLSLVKRRGPFTRWYHRSYLRTGGDVLDALRVAMQARPAAAVDDLMKWWAGEDFATPIP